MNPFSSRSDFGIRSRLFAVLSIIVILFSLLQVLIFYRWFQDSKELEINANLELARAVAKNFENWIKSLLDGQLALGLALTTSPTISEADLGALLTKLQASNPIARSFVWINPNGKVTSSNLPSLIGVDLSDRSFFKKIIEGREWYVNELIVGRATGKITFAVGRAIRAENGDLLGVVAASIEPEKLDAPLGIARSQKDAGFAIVDQMGMVVYRFPHVEYTMEQRNWSHNPEMVEALHGKEITGRVMTTRSERRFAAFVPISSVGWVASCGRSEDAITADILKDLLPLIGLMVLLTIAVFVLAVLGFRPISESIARLHKHVIKLSGGEYDSIPSVGPSEVKTFANALNDMAAKVRSRENEIRESENNLKIANTTLEAKVTERTADLYAINQALEERTRQLRRLAGELTITEQRERKHLSKVLHDGLQQYLVAAKMQLSAISEHSDISVRQTIKTVDDLLGESVQVSRSLATELSPPILHDGGISAGLEWLSKFMAKKHGLNVKMLSEINSPLLLEEDVKVFLFEATRELLLNVVKHAKIKSAQVNLKKENGGLLCITISDQGIGFDPKCLRDGYGCFGLFSIRERIGLLGGNLDFESSPGKGASFTLTVPTGNGGRSV